MLESSKDDRMPPPLLTLDTTNCAYVLIPEGADNEAERKLTAFVVYRST
jgi:hypothetical protein